MLTDLVEKDKVAVFMALSLCMKNVIKEVLKGLSYVVLYPKKHRMKRKLASFLSH